MDEHGGGGDEQGDEQLPGQRPPPPVARDCHAQQVEHLHVERHVRVDVVRQERDPAGLKILLGALEVVFQDVEVRRRQHRAQKGDDDEKRDRRAKDPRQPVARLRDRVRGRPSGIARPARRNDCHAGIRSNATLTRPPRAMRINHGLSQPIRPAIKVSTPRTAVPRPYASAIRTGHLETRRKPSCSMISVSDGHGRGGDQGGGQHDRQSLSQVLDVAQVGDSLAHERLAQLDSGNDLGKRSPEQVSPGDAVLPVVG